MTQLRAAVIGTGHLGRHHARNLARIEGVDLVAVCDPDEERGRAAADVAQTEWVADPAQLPTDLDAVSIAAPTPQHHRLASYFVERGIACLVEKPMCASVDEAEELAALAERKGVIVQVGHIERFNPVLASMKLAGTPRHIDARRLAPHPNRSVDTTVVFDLMIHDIDLVLGWIDSEVVDLRATGGVVKGPKCDWATCALEFKSGATATLTASRVASAPSRKTTLYTEAATCEVDFQARSWSMVDSSLNVTSDTGGDEEPLFLELSHFVAAVREGRVPRVSHREGLAAVRIAHRVLHAIDS